MNLPVWRAVKATYAFVFANLGDVVRVAWLPLTLITGLYVWMITIFVKTVMLTVIAILGSTDPAAAARARTPPEVLAAASEFTSWSYLVEGAGLILGAIVTAAVLKPILRGSWPKGPFYIGSGSDDLRVLGVKFMTFLILLVFANAAVILLVPLLAVSAASKNQVPILVGLLVIGIVYVWLSLRLWLIPPASIATRSIGFGEGWSATKGQVWRLLGFAILLFAPPVAVEGAVLSLLYGFVPLEFSGRMAGVAPSVLKSVPFLPSAGGFIGSVILVYVVASLAIFLLSIAGSGIAYRYLSGMNDDAEGDADTL